MWAEADAAVGGGAVVDVRSRYAAVAGGTPVTPTGLAPAPQAPAPQAPAPQAPAPAPAAPAAPQAPAAMPEILEPPVLKYMHNGTAYTREQLASWTDAQVATLTVA